MNFSPSIRTSFKSFISIPVGNNILILHRTIVRDQTPPKNTLAGAALIPSPWAEQSRRHQGCGQVCRCGTGFTLTTKNMRVMTWIRSLVAVVFVWVGADVWGSMVCSVAAGQILLLLSVFPGTAKHLCGMSFC